MLNYLWTAMLLIGIVVGAATGNVQNISNAVVSSAQDAVNICMTMLGVMVMWTGVMKIAQKSGLLEKMTGLLRPAIRFLFPNIPDKHPAGEYIATNCVANILGLGWAATPAGLNAMVELKSLNEQRCKQQEEKGKNEKNCGTHIASNEMCTFLILNISSLQLIPISIIAYRSQFGSPNPTAVVGPAILATLASTAVAIVFCKMMDRRMPQKTTICKR